MNTHAQIHATIDAHMYFNVKLRFEYVNAYAVQSMLAHTIATQQYNAMYESMLMLCAL